MLGKRFDSAVEELQDIFVGVVVFAELEHFSEFNGLFAGEGASVKEFIGVGRIPS